MIHHERCRTHSPLLPAQVCAHLVVPGPQVADARRINAVSISAEQVGLRSGFFSKHRRRNSLSSDDHGPSAGRVGASASLQNPANHSASVPAGGDEHRGQTCARKAWCRRDNCKSFHASFSNLCDAKLRGEVITSDCFRPGSTAILLEVYQSIRQARATSVSIGMGSYSLLFARDRWGSGRYQMTLRILRRVCFKLLASVVNHGDRT